MLKKSLFVLNLLSLLCLVLSSKILFAEQDTTQITPLSYSKVSVETKLESKSIPLNKELHYEIIINWEGNTDTFQFDMINTPNCENLELKSTTVSNQIYPFNGHYTGVKTFVYIFKPLKEGNAIIYPISIPYTEQGVATTRYLKTSQISATILSPEFCLKDLDKKWIKIFGVCIIIFIIIGIFFCIKKKKAVEKIDFPQKTSFEIYQEKLTQVLNSPFENTKEQFSQISSAVRKVMQEKYGILKCGLNTPELLECIDKLDIPQEEKNNCMEILKFCDAVKFSGTANTTQEEAENIISKIKEVFLKTISN